MQAIYEIGRERDENLLYEEGYDMVCPYHFHRKAELLYVLEGEKRVFVGGKELKLGADNMFVADSYYLHSYLESPESKQIVVVFPNRYLGHFYEQFGGEVLKTHVFSDGESSKRLLPLIRELKNTDRNKLLYQANIDMLLGSIVEISGVEEGNLPDRQSFVERVLEYINDNYSEPIDLSNMAEYFGYSKYYFSRVFNGVLGTGITDYVSTIRLNKTLEMLKNKRCTVSEAALECGFSSIPTFYRALKKNYRYKKISDLL